MIYRFRSVFLFLHTVTRNGAQAKVEILLVSGALKHTVAFLILYQVNLNVVLKTFLPFMAYDI